MESTEKVNQKSWKRIVSIVLNIIFYAFIGILLIFSISNLGLKDNLDIPSIFNRGYLTVLTDSMDGKEEDSFTVEDLIFVKKVTDKNREEVLSEIEVGDIITFAYNVEGYGIILNTHRVVKIGKNTSDEVIYFTQGDKKALTTKFDPNGINPEGSYEIVNASAVKAVYIGQWSNAGKTMKYLRSSTGFMVCIVIPTALFLMFEAVMLIMNIMKIRQKKYQEKSSLDQEEELRLAKEKMRAELLAELQANKAAVDKVEEKENKEEPKE